MALYMMSHYYLKLAVFIFVYVAYIGHYARTLRIDLKELKPKYEIFVRENVSKNLCVKLWPFWSPSLRQRIVGDVISK